MVYLPSNLIGGWWRYKEFAAHLRSLDHSLACPGRGMGYSDGMMRNRLLPPLLLLWLGLSLHLPGQQAEPDRKAFERTKASAEKGDAEAQYQLGLLYANGKGVTKDLTKAAKWTHKAADQGHAHAEYQLGWDYTTGEGVKTNLTAAAKWIRLAAEQGLIEAQ